MVGRRFDDVEPVTWTAVEALELEVVRIELDVLDVAPTETELKVDEERETE